LPINAVIGGVGAAVLLALAATGASPPWAWVFAAVATLVGVVSGVPTSLLTGAQHWRAVSVSFLVTGAGSVVATVLILVLGGGVSGMLAVIAATAAVRYLWLEVLSRRLLASFGTEHEPLGPLRGEIFGFSLAMSVPMIFNIVVNQRSEFFFLERFSNDTQIALYSIAFAATAALIAIPKAIGAILTPSVAKLVGSREFQRIRSGFSRVLRLSLLFGLPLTGAALALGPDLLHLIYGAQYAGAGNVLLIVALTVPLAPLAGASSALLIGYGRVRSPIAVAAVAAALDLTLAALLVPRLDAIGAAIANTSAFFVSTVLLVGAAVRLVGGVKWGWRSILRIAAASGVASVLARLVLVAGNDAGMFVLATAVELVALSICVTTFRAVPEEDASFLVAVAGSRSWVARVLGRISDRALRVPG